MKILLVSPQLHDQAQFLAVELEKIGFQTEVTQRLHPARLILNKYDLIHFLLPEFDVTAEMMISALASQFLQIPCLLSLYSKINPADFKNIKLALFQGLTVHQAGELKKIRAYDGAKHILPFFPSDFLHKINQNKKNLSSTCLTEKSGFNFIIPIQSGFQELIEVWPKGFRKYSDDLSILIDASRLRNKKTAARVRKEWIAFCKKYPAYNQAEILTDSKTIAHIQSQEITLTCLAHLKLHSAEVNAGIEAYFSNGQINLIHEDQATGFPYLWKNNVNCLLVKQTSDLQQLDLLDIRQRTETIYFNHNSQRSVQLENLHLEIDRKLNELSRLYTKLVTQKTSLLKNRSANI